MSNKEFLERRPPDEGFTKPPDELFPLPVSDLEAIF